ncbi:Zinc finger protein CONSTANS-LIKE 13 [Hordeum vulgare]|nr:Zinc finger protein CONSTANS-LIKE 13 [Hordeum vulgare]
MASDDRETREHLDTEVVNEAYMQELRRQHPELVEAERMIFADAKGGEVIILSSDHKVEGGEGGNAEGGEDEEIDVHEWRSVLPDDGTGSCPDCGTPSLTRKDWRDVTFDQN